VAKTLIALSALTSGHDGVSWAPHAGRGAAPTYSLPGKVEAPHASTLDAPPKGAVTFQKDLP